MFARRRARAARAQRRRRRVLHPARSPTRGERALFFGHFGYEANRRGVERFLAEGWPRVRHLRPSARLAIAGGGMDEALRLRLAAVEGVEVLGLVADLPGALAAARAVVVPIWEGGGTRLKVLEALAAGRAVVATSLGASGVGFEDGRHGLLGERPAELAAALVGPARRPASGRRRWASRGGRWPSATAGRRRSPARRRCTRRLSRVSAPTIDCSSRVDADHMA